MIIVKIQGGLGNQMQQYALAARLSTLGRDVKLDISWFTDEALQKTFLAPRALELTRFRDLPMPLCTQQERERFTGGSSAAAKLLRKVSKKARNVLPDTVARGLLGEPAVFEESRMFHPEIFDMDDRYLIGYFACNKYYDEIMPMLRERFVFPESADAAVREKNRTVRAAMQAGDETAVSIHLRRGDYLDAANADILGGICTPAYYESAVRFLEDHAGTSPLHFYVFSDDPDYAAGLTWGTKGEPVTICDWNRGEDSLLDMELMRCCRHNITANSTFSFWGARLNASEGRIMIRPLYHRNNQTPDPALMHDYWKGFTLIDRDGKIV